MTHAAITYRPGLPAAFAMLAGLLLLIEGTWGLFSPVVFGALTINPVRSVLHIALGLAGVLLGYTNRPVGYLLFTGGLMLLVALLWLVPGVGEGVARLLAVNGAAALADVVLGGLALALGLYGLSMDRA